MSRIRIEWNKRKVSWVGSRVEFEKRKVYDAGMERIGATQRVIATEQTEIGVTKDKAPVTFEKETVRAVIVNSEGKILLLQKDSRSKTKYKWELPGGGVDFELPATPEQLLFEIIRETVEETSLVLGEVDNEMKRATHVSVPYGPLGYFDYVRKHKQTKSPTRIHTFFFLLNPDRSAQDIVIDPGDKHRAYKWVAAEELRQMQKAGKISSNSSKVTKHLLRPLPQAA